MTVKVKGRWGRVGGQSKGHNPIEVNQSWEKGLHWAKEGGGKSLPAGQNKRKHPETTGRGNERSEARETPIKCWAHKEHRAARSGQRGFGGREKKH